MTSPIIDCTTCQVEDTPPQALPPNNQTVDPLRQRVEALSEGQKTELIMYLALQYQVRELLWDAALEMIVSLKIKYQK